jgi:hypothetical protein
MIRTLSHCCTGCLLSLLACSMQIAEADIYVYADPNGSVHVTHSPAPDEGLNLLSTYRSAPRARTDYSKYVKRFDSEIRTASVKYDVEEELIRAVIKAESDFDPYAISSAGALGLMQLMPQTAKRFGVNDSFNPAQNIDGGVRYLKLLRKMFNDTRLAVAAYHAGENRVESYGDVPPIPAPLEYVDRVLHFYKQFQKVSNRTKKIYKTIMPNGEVLYTTSPGGNNKGKIYFKVD